MKTNNIKSKTGNYLLLSAIPVVKGLNISGIIVKYDSDTNRVTLPDNTTITGIDITNTTYFKKLPDQVYAVGTYIVYHDSLWSITGFNPIKNIYGISAVDSNQKDTVYPASIHPVSVYWFINSQGTICKTYKGKNTNADIWRGATNNMYDTLDAAQVAYHAIIDNVK